MISTGRRGSMELKRIGDQIGPDSNPAIIRSIEENRITVEHAEREIEIVGSEAKR